LFEIQNTWLAICYIQKQLFIKLSYSIPCSDKFITELLGSLQRNKKYLENTNFTHFHVHICGKLYLY